MSEMYMLLMGSLAWSMEILDGILFFHHAQKLEDIVTDSYLRVSGEIDEMKYRDAS